MPLLSNRNLSVCNNRDAQSQRPLPNQDHLLLQLAIRVVLRADLVVEVQQLFQWLALRRHDKTDDMHKHLGHGIAVEHDRNNCPHRLHLGLVIALLQLELQLLQRRLVRRVVQVNQAVCIFEKRRHGGWLEATAGGAKGSCNLSVRRMF